MFVSQAMEAVANDEEFWSNFTLDDDIWDDLKDTGN